MYTVVNRPLPSPTTSTTPANGNTLGHGIWWKDSVFYQIYPRSFKDTTGNGIGDLDGIVMKLDYLAALGVGVLWISPCFSSPMADFGYDVSDYRDIHPLFGDLRSLKLLLREAHNRNMKVLLDLVPNHTSDQHDWFIESKRSKDSGKRDWYIWKDPKIDPETGAKLPPNNWLSVFGGSAWEYDEASGQYYMHGFLREQPDLNWRNQSVRAEMYDTVRFWLEFGVDGFRVDVTHHMIKDDEWRDNPPNPEYKVSRIGKDIGEYESQLHIYDRCRPESHEILRDFRQVLDSFTGERMMVGEVYVLDTGVAATYYGSEAGPEMNLVFNFLLINLPWVASKMKQYYESFMNNIPQDAQPTIVLGSHDEPRLTTRYGVAAARSAAMMLLTLRGSPFIYYGDEIGMSDVSIPEDKLVDPWAFRSGLLHLSRDPCRTPMQWDTSKHAGFVHSCSNAEPWLPVHENHTTSVNVETQLSDPFSILNLYKALIQFRNGSAVLLKGSYRSLAIANAENVYAFIREFDSQQLLVLINFAAEPITLQLPELASAANKIVLSTNRDKDSEQIDLASFSLAANEGLLIRVTG